MTPDPKGAPTPTSFRPVPGVLAFLLPGAGHFALGQRLRAVYVGAGVLGLFFGGLFIGGIDCVDSKEDRLWFLAQAMVGPVALGADYAHQKLYKGYDPVERTVRSAGPDETIRAGRIEFAQAGEGPPNTKSLAKMNEIGTLYIAIAGMMNLIAIIDAMFPYARRAKVSPTLRSIPAAPTLRSVPPAAPAPSSAPSTAPPTRTEGA